MGINILTPCRNGYQHTELSSNKIKRKPHLKLSNQVHGGDCTIVVAEVFDIDEQRGLRQTDQLTKQLVIDLFINLHIIIDNTHITQLAKGVSTCKLLLLLLHSFNALFSRTTRVSWHQKSRTILVKPIWIY